MRHTTREIGEEFRQFFSSLYSVGQREKCGGNKEEKMREFLKGAGLPTLSELDTLELESPITEEEVFSALKSSPG